MALKHTGLAALALLTAGATAVPVSAQTQTNAATTDPTMAPAQDNDGDEGKWGLLGLLGLAGLLGLKRRDNHTHRDHTGTTNSRL